jgi:hypothetical protein
VLLHHRSQLPSINPVLIQLVLQLHHVVYCFAGILLHVSDCSGDGFVALLNGAFDAVGGELLDYGFAQAVTSTDLWLWCLLFFRVVDVSVLSLETHTIEPAGTQTQNPTCIRYNLRLRFRHDQIQYPLGRILNIIRHETPPIPHIPQLQTLRSRRKQKPLAIEARTHNRHRLRLRRANKRGRI